MSAKKAGAARTNSPAPAESRGSRSAASRSRSTGPAADGRATSASPTSKAAKASAKTAKPTKAAAKKAATKTTATSAAKSAKAPAKASKTATAAQKTSAKGAANTTGQKGSRADKASATSPSKTAAKAAKRSAAKAAPAATKTAPPRKAAAMTSTTSGKKASAAPRGAGAAGGSKARGSRVGASRPATEAEVERLTQSLKVKEDEAPWTAQELRSVGKFLREEIEAYEREIGRAEEDLASFIQNSSDGGGEDQADAGAKTFERDHEIALANNSRDMLRQTERALEQLRAGTYGICENCGNPIGKLRLQARPRATLCMTCQEKQDRH